jgi:hypothetical protein
LLAIQDRGQQCASPRARASGGSGGHACHGPSLPAAGLSWDGAARQAEVGAGGAAAEAKGSLAPVREGSDSRVNGRDPRLVRLAGG